MVIKGRSRTNGVQLANYLLQSKQNDRASVLEIRGTAQPEDLLRSLREMSLSSELTKRGKLGLYHAQMNPAIGEDRPMTQEDWLKAADILEQSLGLDGQKRAIVLHEKNGRIHGHIVWERYDHDTGKLRADGKNYKLHDQARAQIEQELGHERTPQRRDREPTDKERLTQLWQEHPDGKGFIEAAEKAGYIVAQGNDRRPFRVVTPDGQSLDLVRQLEEIKTKAVRGRLHPIRADLPTEAEALQRAKTDRQPVPELSDNLRELSDSQDRAAAMKAHYKEQVKREMNPVNDNTPSSQNVVPPSLPQQQEEKTQSDKSPEISDKAEAMLKAYRQRQADRQQQQKIQEVKKQAVEQTKKQEHGKSLTDPAAEMLERYRQKQRERGHDRDGPEY